MKNDLFTSYQTRAQVSLPEAESLPFAVYHDPQVYSLETQQVFRQEWIFVCAEQQLSEAGDYFAFSLAGEALALIRGKDGDLRALSNNCRHRGTPLLDEGFGSIEKLIVCPYHAWAYDDQGRLKGAPFTGDVKLNKDKHCLPQFQIDTWMGLVFINLSENPRPLIERLQGLKEYLDIFEPERFKQAYAGGEECWNANWKLAMENAMESYHLFKVHKQTLETVTPSKEAYYVAGSSEWSLSGGKMLDTRSAIGKFFSTSYPEAYDHYLLISLPPSFVGIITYESFDWIQVLPGGPETCVVRAGGMAETSSKKTDKMTQNFVDAFFAEDKWICERVQKGMHSHYGSGGQLVSMEKILVDFRQYLSSRLFQTSPDNFIETAEASRFYKDS